MHENINANINFSYITFLRSPLDRIISEYHYLRSSPRGYPLFDREIYEKKMPLDEFVRNGLSVSVDNLMVRAVSGIGCEGIGTAFHTAKSVSKKKWKGISEEDLKLAKVNIGKYYNFVGITELFDESMLLLREKLGWKNISYKRSNIGDKKREIPNSLKEEIIDLNKWDYKLYEYCKEQFVKECDNYDVENKLDDFRKKNQPPPLLRKLSNRIYSLAKSSIRSLMINKPNEH